MNTTTRRYFCASLFVSAIVGACGGSDTAGSATVGGTGGTGNAGTDGEATAGSAGDGAAGVNAGGFGGGSAGAPPTPPMPLLPNLPSLQLRFFTPSCASPLCQSTKQKAGGISLASEAESCAALVGVAATEAGASAPGSCAKGAAAKAGMSSVKPGSPDESFLYLSQDGCRREVRVGERRAGWREDAEGQLCGVARGCGGRGAADRRRRGVRVNASGVGLRR